MKAIALITGLTLLSTAVLATAQDRPICYMQTKAGLLLSLEKLCDRRNQTLVRSLSVEEQKFLDDLKRSMRNAPEAQATIDPQAAIEQAKRICSELEAGTFLDYRKAQAELIAEYSDSSTRSILRSRNRTIQTVAPKYFCPAFNG